LVACGSVKNGKDAIRPRFTSRYREYRKQRRTFVRIKWFHLIWRQGSVSET
jgi:hypothetical protein